MSSINASLRFLKVAVNNHPVSNGNHVAIMKSKDAIRARANELQGAVDRCLASGCDATEQYRKSAIRAQSYLAKNAIVRAVKLV
jgi:hypothetical protein